MHVQEVRRLTRESKLPAYRLPGVKRYFYFRSEILEWIRSHPVNGEQA